MSLFWVFTTAVISGPPKVVPGWTLATRAISRAAWETPLNM